MDLEKVRDLRERTGAGIVECKNALVESKGDIDQAVEVLRKKGIAQAAKKVGRTAKEGVVDAYIHPGERLGVLIEINCETDFVSRTPEFRRFVRDVALQIAAADPLCISREDVTKEVIDREKEIYASQVAASGKPPQVIENIVKGKLEKFFSDVCLLEQPFVKSPERTVGEYAKEHIAKFGENIVIRRFTRFKLGE